ncbi:MAG: sialidase family protein, partial [Rufibacter sp.]
MAFFEEQQSVSMMRQYLKISILLLCVSVWAGCGDDNEAGVEPVVEENTKSRAAISGSRIAWDFTTLKRVSTGESGYHAYARLIQLHDKSLICVYESNGRIATVRSSDLGVTWSAPVIVAAKPAGYNNTVPDIMQLRDNSILVSYNPRPHDPLEPAKRFGIRTKKSYDGGLTWRDERLLYEAGYQFENGCWEPAPIQLPNGEVQVYFANEGPYTSSSEQNISMVSSNDGGLTWTSQPKTVSFRAGKRDGMPSPLLLQNGKDIVVAIEDDGVGNFKPYTVRTTLANNWATPVTGSSSDRDNSLVDPLGSSIYAGAPYIRQLKTGETIMSYQGTEGRTNHLNNSEMKVVIGNSEAKGFNRKTVPFVIPGNTNGLWNSLAVLDDGTVVAV